MKIIRLYFLFVVSILFLGNAKAQNGLSSLWNLKLLYQTPKIYPTNKCKVKGFKSFYYEGVEYKGAPERVFVYYKTPSGTPPPGGWPAVVCVHGGGGTAFPAWVQSWVDHGYAAIAMDLTGHLPEGKFPNRDWHLFGGPPRITCFGDIELADREQWFYHAVAIVIRANSLLRSFPEINPNKIGIHGISWGGVITSAVMGLDPRFAFAIPVYGCGYLYNCGDENFKKYFNVMTDKEFHSYITKWDPSLYLPLSKIPSLWIKGTNDPWFPMDIWQKSLESVKGPVFMRVPIRLKHAHIWTEKEIYAFANAAVKGGIQLAKVGNVSYNSAYAKVHVESKTKLTNAELCYTKDSGVWENRFWQSNPAEIDVHNVVIASIPPHTKAFYFNITDERGLTVSSKYTNIEDTVRSIWYRYNRIDFRIDGKDCLVVFPKERTKGNPWIWRMRFFGNQPQADIAMLEKGYCIAFMDLKDMYGSPLALDYMDKFYSYLSKKYKLNTRMVLEGFSRGGLFAFNWAARHPDSVACMYVDAPVCDFKSWPAGLGKSKGSANDWEKLKKVYGLTEKEALQYKFNPVDNLAPLVKADIPIISVYGDSDKIVPVNENIGIVETRYKKLGGRIEVIIKHNAGHHPHSLKDPSPIVNFITENYKFKSLSL
jgi:pimeloyl-ACP methyl ester carboxylesterase